MSINLNSVMLGGRLVADPELQYTSGGTARGRCRIACTRVWYDNEKQKQEDVTFVPITCWGAAAENLSNYRKKGDEIVVEGRLRIYQFETDEGEKRSLTEVVAHRIHFGATAAANRQDASQSTGEDTAADYGDEGEVPF